MKTINDYIVESINIAERIRIDNIKQAKFPIDGKIEDIIAFLESFGFKEIYDIKGRSITDFFNSKHDRCYWLRDKEWIYFGDTSKTNITPTNELFMINITNGNGEYRILNNYSCSSDYHNNTKAFLEILNKQFNW